MSPRSISTRRPPDFVKKLYFALEAAQQTHEPDLRWVSPGEFEITGDQKRALEVLQRYQLDFKLFSSFVRQLSYYNFKRLSDRRRSDARGKPGVKENIHFGHPARDFWTGNAGKAFAVMIRKSRKRKDRASVTSNCSTSYSDSADDGALSPTHSGDSGRRGSVASIDSHGRHSMSSDYVTPQTSLAAFPSNAQKPSFINLNASVHEQAVSTLPVYPSPLSPSAVTPYWTHEHSPLAQGSPYATMPAGSDRMPPGENVFSYTFGAATRGMTAPMSSYYYPNEGKHASSSNLQAGAYYPSQHERYMAVDAARWGQVDSQPSLSSAALPTPPDYYLPPYN
ncbi:BQ5605_C016g08148 [Microbotryum silenes-dioicae]|uniref:BQ5605_C016g08148 protein n=1 Tax=Microbotryum silenes-dioicae TaxID=796604 RepID=A0A2X0LVL8_9BASI|nr:BQ5605_C016g08148 [Microbotryum silenes-dioicae]